MYARYCALRDAKKVRDADVARAIGAGQSTFSDWKNGRSIPKREKLEKIARYFGVSIDYLMTGEASDGYYLNPETAKQAQEMFEDPDMRSLFHMKRNMDPDVFKVHIDAIKQLYKLEHPDDDTGC